MTFDYLSPLEVLHGVLIVFSAYLVWLTALTIRHRRNLARVPIRIHVAGTRGKTSVARYIGAGLRAGGKRVLVKTTGTSPSLVLPNGAEQDWHRRGAPSISEQARFFALAARLQVDAVVLESMAIEPEYLWASEKYLVQATHVAITNLHPDHGEVFGNNEKAMAEAISLIIPDTGNVFLTEAAHTPVIRDRADSRKTIIHLVNSVHPDDPSAAEDDAGKEGFDMDNRRLARAICEHAGVNGDLAIGGMDTIRPDPGAFFIREIEVGGKPLRFHNAFACNDIQSFSTLWRENRPQDQVVVLLNCRYDRPMRTREFLLALARIEPRVTLALVGIWPAPWVRKLIPRDMPLHRVAAQAPDAVLAEIAAIMPGSSLWGVGNYSDLGEKLIRHVQAAGKPC